VQIVTLGYIYVLSYLEEKVRIPLIGLIPPHLCACPMPRASFLTTFGVVLFYIQRVEGIVRFIVIGGIVDHYCLNNSFNNDWSLSIY
jgi:hypothetical protein